ncbi:MAG: 16S rRNA (guanine(966)-N(2))-methyltransferase RsmD [Bacilli bacterium]
MRIISGSRRGKKLMSLAGDATRPTTDKVKESLFNIIGPYFDGGEVLDLFAGSGNLALEAISRGATHATLCERNPKAADVIRKNIIDCKFEKETTLLVREASGCLDALHASGKTFDYVFLDPPYRKGLIEEMMEKMGQLQLVNAEGFIVCEHGRDEAIPSTIGPYERYRYVEYGTIAISLFEPVTKE